MPPIIALSFGAAIVGLALFGRTTSGKEGGTQAPSVLAETEPASPAGPTGDVDEDPDAEPSVVEDSPLAPSSAKSSGYDLLPDGSPVPELPQGTPNSVKFGVVLFQYAGAQAAPGQPRLRSKDAARALAEQTLELARTDFSKAVEKGDRGSAANAGNMPRGVLEPSVEYVLFTLEKGTVHPEPLDTPRGYWIVRRIQ